MRLCVRKTVCAMIGLASSIHSVQAQSLKFQSMPRDVPQYAIRFLRPNFDGDDDLSLLSGCYDLTFNIPATSSLNVTGSIPYCAFSGYGESETGFGNLYIGIQTRDQMERNEGRSLEAGLYLPTSANDNYALQFMGTYTNFYEMHKYLPNTLTVAGNFAFVDRGSEGTFFGFELGPNIWIPTEGHNRDTEILLHYGVRAGIGVDAVTLQAEWTGAAILSEDADSFDERTVHALAVGLSVHTAGIVPSVFYETYLDDDLGDFMDNVLGFKLEKALN